MIFFLLRDDFMLLDVSWMSGSALELLPFELLNIGTTDRLNYYSF